ncbi:hypothetical protein D3C76_576770 [compost metagenome]
MQFVGQHGVHAQGVRQAVAGTVDAVLGFGAQDGRAGQSRPGGVVAQQVGIGVVFVALVGELQTVPFGVVPTQFGQQVLGGVVEWVGFFAVNAGAGSSAIGVGGLAVATAHVQQTIYTAQAPGEGGAAAPAVVAAVIAGFQAGVGVVAFVQVVGGILGQVADGTADGIAAVQGRRRATDDFHGFDGVQVDVVAAYILEGAEEVALRYTHAVDLGQHAVTFDTADVGAFQAETIARTADRNARLVTHQVLEVLVVVLVDFPFGVDRHGARHLQQGLLGLGGSHADCVELGFRRLSGQGQRGRKQQQGYPGTTGERRADRHLT